MNLKQHAKEQEERVHQVLTMLHNAMCELDTPHENGTSTAFFINYDEQDMFHAATIFYSVCSNYAIKHGFLNNENCFEKNGIFQKGSKGNFWS